jgi:hypothetical protein
VGDLKHSANGLLLSGGLRRSSGGGTDGLLDHCAENHELDEQQDDSHEEEYAGRSQSKSSAKAARSLAHMSAPFSKR